MRMCGLLEVTCSSKIERGGVLAVVEEVLTTAWLPSTVAPATASGNAVSESVAEARWRAPPARHLKARQYASPLPLDSNAPDYAADCWRIFAGFQTLN